MSDAVGALIETWRERALRAETRGARLAAEVRKECADELEAARTAGGWQPMEHMPDDVRQVIVCWSTGEFDVIGKAEYLECLGYGEPPARGWMPLPSAPRAQGDA